MRNGNKMQALNATITYIPNDSLTHFIEESDRKARKLDDIEADEH